MTQNKLSNYNCYSSVRLSEFSDFLHKKTLIEAYNYIKYALNFDNVFLDDFFCGNVGTSTEIMMTAKKMLFLDCTRSYVIFEGRRKFHISIFAVKFNLLTISVR